MATLSRGISKMAATMGKTKPPRKGRKMSNIKHKKRKQKSSGKGNDPIKVTLRETPLSLKVKGEWKSVDVDYNLFSPDELAEFGGVEELTDYELVEGLIEEEDSNEASDSTPTGKSELNEKGQKRKQKDEVQQQGKSKRTKHSKREEEQDSETPGISILSGEIIHARTNLPSIDDDSDEFEDEDAEGEEEEDQDTRTSKAKRKQEKDKKSKVEKGKKDLGQEKDKDAKTKEKKPAKKQGQKNEEQKGASKKKDAGSYTKGVDVPQREQALDMSAWDHLSIPKPVLQALQDMGFTIPTPIQSESIPAAVKERKDIMGAAETGSGKTLAFGIPILHHILRLKKSQKSQTEKSAPGKTDDVTKDDEDDGQSEEESDNETPSSNNEHDDEDEDAEEGEEEFKWDDEEELEWESDDSKEDGDGADDDADKKDDDDDEEEGNNDDVDDESDGEFVSSGHQTKVVTKPSGDLLALVMTPTRELAVQVKNHLVAAAKYTDIKIAVVVGGVSAEKQRRLLKKKPEIVVGTPGRLWELFIEREPHLCNNLAHVRFLVIDEADRMVERGHYMELSNIMDLLNGSPMHKKRQNFIFSATLTMVHVGPRTTKPTKNAKQKDKTKLDTVLEKVSVRENAKVVDLTRKQGTVASLLEGKIVCNLSEKDIYLYYFLLQYPGRTLVFTNSIEAIRRMVSILTLLQCNPLPLHSSMHQRQRLKNLDRFAANPTGLLLATDVAARGLDIPNVQHVIHYHVPKTSESYVHRSGRTARQAKEGLSIMLVQAQEVKSFRKVCKALDRDDLPNFPTELKYYEAVKERVDLARQVDKLELSVTKKRKQNQWYENAAKEMDIDLDDWIVTDMGSDTEQKQHNSHVRHLRGELKSLLKRKIFPRWTSQLYPTLDGALVKPFVSSDSAGAMSSFKTKISKDKKEDDARKEKKTQKFRKFKRRQKMKQQQSAAAKTD